MYSLDALLFCRYSAKELIFRLALKLTKAPEVQPK